MPSRGIPGTYPAPPLEWMASGLIGLSPTMPVPCSIWIFSSIVISLTTIEARSSGERLRFIQGCDVSLFCERTRMGKTRMKNEKDKKRRFVLWDMTGPPLCVHYNIDIVAGGERPRVNSLLSGYNSRSNSVRREAPAL